MEQTFYSIHDYYISHHGVKGQKWGIRRYQNPDGTLTEEGKKRYEKIKSKYDLDEKNKTFSTDRSAKKQAIRSLGLYGGYLAGAMTGAATGNLPLMLGSIGVALSAPITGIASAINRERARRFVNKTGLASAESIRADRNKTTTMASNLLSTGLVGSLFGPVTSLFTDDKKAHAVLKKSVNSIEKETKNR